MMVAVRSVARPVSVPTRRAEIGAAPSAQPLVSAAMHRIGWNVELCAKLCSPRVAVTSNGRGSSQTDLGR